MRWGFLDVTTGDQHAQNHMNFGQDMMLRGWIFLTMKVNLWEIMINFVVATLIREGAS